MNARLLVLVLLPVWVWAADVPALLVQDHLLVPTRMVVEGLGGTVAYTPATRKTTLTLGNQRHTLWPDSDAISPYGNCERRGVLYTSLLYLSNYLEFNVAWDTQTNTATVWRGEHRLRLVPTSVAMPTPHTRGLHPLIDARTGMLVGGTFRGCWGDDDAIAKQVSRLTYRTYALTGPRGRVTGGVPQAEDAGAGYSLDLASQARGAADVLGLRAGWDAMPRLPVRLNSQGRIPARLARQVLADYGMPAAPVRVTQALQADLLGDGRYTTLVTAEYPPSIRERDWGRTNDYSFVAARTPTRDGWRRLVLAGVFCPETRSEEDVQLLRLAGILDVDGDGAQEIVIHYTVYEGEGCAVYRLVEGRAYQVYASYWGL